MADNKTQERIAAGIEALQNDQARRNVEAETADDPLTSVFTLREQAAIKQLVHEALVDFFKSYGLKGKNGIITAGILVGSIVVILGGVKMILGWIGFAYVSK